MKQPRVSVDIRDMRERLEREKTDPKQSIASLIRTLLFEALEARTKARRESIEKEKKNFESKI